jgi:UDP-N-acetyl-D-mannosaminuronate dehydrogenase
VESHPEFSLSPLKEALEKADIIVVLVGHSPFKKTIMPDGKQIIDFIGLNH